MTVHKVCSSSILTREGVGNAPPPRYLVGWGEYSTRVCFQISKVLNLKSYSLNIPQNALFDLCTLILHLQKVLI